MHELSARQSLDRRVTHPAQSGPQPATFLRPFANRQAPFGVFLGVHSNETAAGLAYQTKGESAPRSGNRIPSCILGASCPAACFEVHRGWNPKSAQVLFRPTQPDQQPPLRTNPAPLHHQAAPAPPPKQTNNAARHYPFPAETSPVPALYARWQERP